MRQRYTIRVTLAHQVKVEKTLKGSLDLISPPLPSVKIQIIGRKVYLRRKQKHFWALSTNFWKQKGSWHHPAMFCLITSSKLSCQWFEFSLKVMRSKPGYLHKSFLLYLLYYPACPYASRNKFRLSPKSKLVKKKMF